MNEIENIESDHTKLKSNYENANNDETSRKLFTLSNIKYIVEGLDSLLQTNLDGEKRQKVIELRDMLIESTTSLFSDFS